MMGKTAGFAAVALALAVMMPAAHADSITVNGRAYDDVLVYKSSSIYYVKIPQEGRVISVPVERIDASTVSINDDPYYRDQLKQRYDQAKADVEAGRPVAGAPTDPAFDVPDSSGAAFDSSAFYSAGAGKPLNLTQQAVQGDLTKQGFQFTGTTGKTADGVLSVQLEGPADNLTGIVVTATGQQAQLMAAMPKVFGLIGQKAPWAQGWLMQNMAALSQGQPIQNAQNGVLLNVSPAQQGANVSLTVTMRGA
jgi:hypothetical protein